MQFKENFNKLVDVIRRAKTLSTAPNLTLRENQLVQDVNLLLKLFDVNTNLPTTGPTTGPSPIPPALDSRVSWFPPKNKKPTSNRKLVKRKLNNILNTSIINLIRQGTKVYWTKEQVTEALGFRLTINGQDAVIIKNTAITDTFSKDEYDTFLAWLEEEDFLIRSADGKNTRQVKVKDAGRHRYYCLNSKILEEFAE